MKRILLIGSGGHSRSLIDLIETTGQWNIYGLIGFPHQIGGNVLGYPIIGSDEDLPKLRKNCSSAVLAIGQLPNPAKREKYSTYLRELNFHFPVLFL